MLADDASNGAAMASGVKLVTRLICSAFRLGWGLRMVDASALM